MKKFLLAIALLLVVSYFVLDSILQKSTFPVELQSGINYTGVEVANLTLENGQNIEIVFSKKEDDLVFVYFHGNAGRLSYVVDFLKERHSFVSPSYPGYGKSTGTPSVQNVYESVSKTQEFVSKEFAGRKIFVIGHSLGSQTALRYAKLEENIKAISVVAGFDSVYNVCKDRFQNAKIICVVARKSFNAVKDSAEKPFNFKFFFFHHPQDNVISIKRGQKLFDKINTKEKEFIKLTTGNHGFFDLELVTQEMLTN
jgi:pimeloyl-ACP methyl ester carboxylesterase